LKVSGTLDATGLNLSTANLIPGDNIDICNNVISAFLGADSIVNINSLHSDGNVDVVGALNVCQTSTFGGALNVSNTIYSGVAGQHEGSLVLYSNILGNNFQQIYNASGTEVDITATGTATAINYFVGGTNVLRISPNAFQVNAIDANIIDTNELTANVFTCIDGKATFRFNTPTLNASTINADVGIITDLNASDIFVHTLDVDVNITSPFANIDSLTADTLGGTTATFNQVNVANALQLFNCNLTGANTIGTLQLNAGTANVTTINNKTINSSTINASTIEIDEIDLITINASQGNFSNISTLDITAENICALFFIQCERLNASLTITGSAIISEDVCQVGQPGEGGAKILFYGPTLSEKAEFTLTSDFNIDTKSVNNINFIIDDAVLMAVNSNGINASQANLSTINVSLIIAENISGYQETLIAGANISIVGNTISTLAEPIPSDINFSSINASNMVIDNDLLVDTINNSFLNTSFITCNDEASFGSSVAVTGAVSCAELDTDQVFTINLSSSALDAVNITTDTITSFQHNISDSSDDAEASFLIRDGSTTRFIHTGGRLRFECNELQTSGVANFSTINASNIIGYQQTLIAGDNISIVGNTISTLAEPIPTDPNFSSVNTSTLNASVVNGDNLSTATMVFTSDFNLQTFGNVLSLTKPLLSVNEVVAGLKTKDVVTKSLNTSSLNVDGFTTLDIVTISLGLNSTNNNLFNINSSGTANISTGNFSTINASNLSTATMNFGADLTFDTFSNTLSLTTTPEEAISDIETNGLVTSSVNTSQLNVDGFSTFDAVAISLGLNSLVGNINTINSSGSANISVGNFSTINASNIVGYQETLIAGDNISIVGNTISRVRVSKARFAMEFAVNRRIFLLCVE